MHLWETAEEIIFLQLRGQELGDMSVPRGALSINLDLLLDVFICYVQYVDKILTPIQYVDKILTCAYFICLD